MEYFSAEALQQIEDEYLTVHSKYRALLFDFLNHPFQNEAAKEFATQGFLRRLKTLARCIENVFEALPPNQVELPTDDELSDATINVQAFIFNVFGCIDNLAWIWVCERNLTKPDRSPIPHSWVGLAPENKFIRESFSIEFQLYLDQLDEWFIALQDYRHALAHRIPLYIPPFIISPDKEADYRDLERRKLEAITGSDGEYDRLSAEQNALATFRPVIMHSFIAKAKPMVFHPQMLANFNTIFELGQKVLQELRS